MGYSEFPFTAYAGDYQGGDMSEFITMYKKLVSDYSGTLNRITALDTRLTTYESSINTRMNDMRDNTIPTLVLSEVTRQVASSTVELRTDLDNAKTRFSTDISQLQTKLNELTTVTESNKRLLGVQIEAVDKDVNGRCDRLESRLTELDQNLRELIATTDANTQEFLTGLIELSCKKVHDDSVFRDSVIEERAERFTEEQVRRLNDKIETLKLSTDTESIRGIWNYAVTYGGYSAEQWYEDTEITCDDWNEKEITCIDWYIRARELFNWFYRSLRIFSPFTGKLEFPNDVLIEVVDYLKDLGLKAGEYDAMNVSAETYDAKQISAFDYDFRGKEILTNVQ